MIYTQKQNLIINRINVRGLQNNPQFRFKAYDNTNPNRVIIELLDGSDPKNRLISEILRVPHKNFYHHYLTLTETMNLVNKIGSQSNPVYIFSSVLPKLSKNRKRIIRVYCPETKEYAERELNELVNKLRNPFREKKELYEQSVIHPELMNYLKKWNVKIIHYEKYLLKGIKPDFVIQGKNNKIYFLEVKTISSKRKIYKGELFKQVEKYNKVGKALYKQQFAETLLVSPDGSNHCISFEQLKNILS